jgi:light-regulated signal transduction histidine kinase (bacteriophytochrome)
MNALITDFLLLMNLHSENQKKEPVHLNAILQQVQIETKDLILNNSAEIETEELPIIEGNSNQLLVLFKNLINNAIKFQKVGIAPRIKVTCELMEAKDILELKTVDDKEYAKVSFADNGIGIDQKYFRKVFEIFQRLHNINEYEGTGIGLAICKKVMGNHGGFITVQSKPGKGSLFSCYFLLP